MLTVLSSLLVVLWLSSISSLMSLVRPSSSKPAKRLPQRRPKLFKTDSRLLLALQPCRLPSEELLELPCLRVRLEPPLERAC